MCQKNNINSMGFSGADGNLIQANKRPAEPIDFGFVGDISKNSVNVSFLKKILQLELTPVICAITHNNEGQLLNTNADAIANAIATSLAPFYEVELVYCFEKKGVLLNPDDEDSYIKNLCLKEFHDLKNKNIINKGMIPKLENCFDALQNGVSEIGIINASNIANYLNKNNNEGTRIR
ncbi:MAG TPA: hypothetical protein DDZ41_03260 [Flavobacterium sp.]|nr:hypothetical protein [Flavobacterium sp.]